MKKFFSLTAILATAVLASGTADAALSVGDANYVGLINDGVPSGDAFEASYVNNLTTLAAGAGNTVIGSETYNRLQSTLVPSGGFDTAVTAGLEKTNAGTISLGGTFYQYILAKYDQDQAGSIVWYFEDGISGDVTVQGSLNGHNVSHITAFNVTDGGGGGGSGGAVPEPASLALMGLGSLLAGVGLRRRQKKLAD